MDNRTCFCRNPRCTLYGRGAPLAQLKFCDWHFGAARFQCRACRQRVAARTGTVYTGMRTDLSTYLHGAVARGFIFQLADGEGQAARVHEDDRVVRRGARCESWRALELVRDEFEPRTWQMFWLTFAEERSPVDVAAEMGVTPAAALARTEM